MQPEHQDPQSARAARARDADALDELVFACLERCESQGTAAIEAVCAEHPEQAERLRARMSTLREAGLVGADESARESVPERLGDFRLLERLGAGGMGVVYLAEQSSLGRRVALKLIRPEHAYFGGARERFRREVEAVARLEHPSIVRVHTVGEAEGIAYFAMEFVEGATLESVIAAVAERAPATLDGEDLRRAVLARSRATRAPDEVRAPVFEKSWTDACLWIAREVADALEHAHRRGVLHRDVKPSNVMLTPEGRVLLLDFGLAALAGSGPITRTGSQLGSLPYMPPEQVDGRASGVGPRADVYALGALLYEMLGLRPAFASPSSIELQRKILESRPTALRKQNPSLSVDVETVVASAMQREPERRYASADDLARDLSNLLERRPIGARRASALERAALWTRRNPAWATAAALGALLLFGAPALFALQQSSARSRLEQANEALRAESQKVHAQFERAEQNFARALAAVDLLTDVGQNRLEQVPRAEEARRELLEAALRFHEGLREQKSDDPALRLQSATAAARAGVIQGALGRYEDAQHSYLQAIEILESIEPEKIDVDLRLPLAGAHMRLGKTLQLRGEVPSAVESLRTSIALFEAAERDDGGQADTRVQRMEAQQFLGEALAMLGENDEAAEVLEAARNTGEELVASAPELRSSRYMLALTLHRLGLVRRYELPRCERGLELARGLVVEDPANASYRSLLVGTLLSMGDALAHADRLDDAHASWAEAVEIGEALVRDFPATARYREDLASASTNLGTIAHLQGDLTESVEQLRRAVVQIEALAREHPDVPDYRAKLGACELNLASTLVDDGQSEAALDLLDDAERECARARELQPGHPDGTEGLRVVHMLRVFGLLEAGRSDDAIAAARAMPKEIQTDQTCLRIANDFSKGLRALEGHGDAEAARRLRDEGLAWLRRSVELGLDSVEDIRDPDLEPLSELAEYAALVAEVETRARRSTQ